MDALESLLSTQEAGGARGDYFPRASITRYTLAKHERYFGVIFLPNEEAIQDMVL